MKKEDNKKVKIVEAAIELFAQKGFEGTSIRDISKLANASVSMISYHFGNKEGLYKSILDDLYERQMLYINKYYDEKAFERLSQKEKAEFFLIFIDKMVDFLYEQMSDKLMVFLVKGQQDAKTAFIPPGLLVLRKILAQILNLKEETREVIYITVFIASQINSPRITNIFIKPYGQCGFIQEDIKIIRNNVKNYIKMIFKNAGINL